MSDDLPMGWNVANLKEIAQLINGDRGKNYPSKEALINQGVPFINAGHLVDGCIDFANMNYISNEHFQILGSGKVQSNDLIYCIRGSLGKIAIVEDVEEGAIASSLVILRPNENTFTKYLYYFLVSPLGKTEISKHDNGTAQPNLSSANVGFYQVPLPPRNEQRRIVDKLDRIGDRHRTARNELSHIPKLIARYKQAVLTAACSGKLTEDWHTNSISSSKNKSVLLSEALLELKTGPFGSVLHKSDYVTDGIPIVNPMHINDGNITPSSEMTISIDKAKELSDFILKSGDVVIARRGVVGRCAVVQPKQDGWLCGTGSMILRPKLHLSPEYLQIFLSSPNTIEVLTADAVGSTMVNLNQRGLLSLEILLPQLEEQKEIVRRVEKMFEKIDMMEQEYQKAAKLCDRLEQATLAKAFRGELVPQDPDDEPASVLLEQVKREKEKGKIKTKK